MPSAEPQALTFNAKRSRHIDVADKSEAEVAGYVERLAGKLAALV